MKKNIILISVMALIIYGCGSSASSPTTPAQIPTSVEYAAGDAIIAGGMPSIGVSGSLSFGKEATVGQTATAVYAISSASTITTATIDEHDNFYIPVPAGYTYALIFMGDGWMARYFDGDTGLHSVPLNLVTGATASGTAQFDENRTAVASDAAAVDLGGLTVTEGDNGVYIAGGGSGASIPEQTEQTQEDAELISVRDGILNQIVTCDGERDLERNVSIGHSFLYPDDLTVGDLMETSLEQLITDFTSPGGELIYFGYSYMFELGSNRPLVEDLGETAYMTAPIAITGTDGSGSASHSAGSQISSCSGFSGDDAYSFFGTSEGCRPVTLPVIPEDGEFTFTAGDLECTVVFPVRPAEPTISAQVGDETVIEDIPYVVPKMTLVDGYVTSLDWQWIIKTGGVWNTNPSVATIRNFVKLQGGDEGSGYLHFMLIDVYQELHDVYVSIDGGDNVTTRGHYELPTPVYNGMIGVTISFTVAYDSDLFSFSYISPGSSFYDE